MIDANAPSRAGAGQPPVTATLDARCAHAGGVELGMATPPASPPLVSASAFAMKDLEHVQRSLDGQPGYWGYSRYANPTVAAFEEAVASLEGAEAAVAAASGMGAIASALLAFLRPCDRLVTAGSLYGVTRSLIDLRLAPMGIVADHRTPDGLVACDGLPPDTRVIFAEAISNPLLRVADIPALARLARASGARLVIDATFATPVSIRPLALGADIVLHSASKYLGGHSDLIAGVAAGAADSIAEVRTTLSTFGANAGPFEAWLALRGLRTLHLRVARQSANAEAAAAWLGGRPEVERVLYPTRDDHPDRAVAEALLDVGGGMVTFDLRGGRGAFERFLGALRMIRLVPSLAGVETTLSHPPTTSHRAMTPEARAAEGIAEGQVRLSCGVEAAADILADLELGMRAVND